MRDVQTFNTCTFNMSTEVFEHKKNMKRGRTCHGLQKIEQKIYAFGGKWKNVLTPWAEFYDVAQNSWKKLPDMPESCENVTCAPVQNRILITSRNFRIISFDIDNEAYAYVG